MNRFVVEENMKSPFIIRRQSLPHPLAEHRWDRIYQLLLRWSSIVEQEHFVPRSHQMEVEDERGSARSIAVADSRRGGRKGWYEALGCAANPMGLQSNLASTVPPQAMSFDG